MKRTFAALATAAAVAATAIAVPTQADARWHGGWRGGGVAAGVIGGLAAGALIAGSRPYYGYGYYPAYPAYAYGGGCYWRHERVWDGWGWRIRPVRVCY